MTMEHYSQSSDNSETPAADQSLEGTVSFSAVVDGEPHSYIYTPGPDGSIKLEIWGPDGRREWVIMPEDEVYGPHRDAMKRRRDRSIQQGSQSSRNWPDRY